MKISKSLLVFSILVIGATGCQSSDSRDWPQWRGPERTNISAETGLIQDWPAAGPKLKWLFRHAGFGYSSMAVVGDRLYTMGARDDAESVIAIDATTGAEVWSTEIDSLFENHWGNGPRSTPTVVDHRVYALGANGNLVCLNADDGARIWQQRLTALGGTVPRWGYTESVLVDDGKVLCTPGGAQGAIAALDATSGALIWQSSEFTDGAQYTSIIAPSIQGARHYVQLTMENVVGINPADGRMLWRVGFPGTVAVAPTPISRNNRVYVTAGYGVGCQVVEIDPDHNSREIYANKVMKNHHGGVVLLGDHVYGYSDKVGWVCQEFDTGKLVWNEEEGAPTKGALTYADGRFYCLGQDGDVALIDAQPTAYKEHGRFTLNPQSRLRKPDGGIWSQPVVAGGTLYLRDQELLFAFDVKANASQ
jgi:outer membrane protein assembly factor BamB